MAATAFAAAKVIAQETEELLDKGCSNTTNVETETTDEQVTVPAAQVVRQETEELTTEKPPPPKLTKRTKVPVKNLIPLEENAFDFKQDGTTRQSTKENNTTAARSALSRAVKRLNIAINSPSLNDKQRVVAHRSDSTHHKSRRFFQSAGLSDVKKEKMFVRLCPRTTPEYGC